MNPWHRLFARLYDLLLSKSEKEWLGARRQSLLGGARGRVLEIGAGTGANLPYYPKDTLVFLGEPDPAMMARARTKAVPNGSRVFHQACRAEALPFGDSSFDTVVSTLVLCTVSDPRGCLQEIRRVLRPEGHFLFIEHVRGGGRRGLWQDRITPLWSILARGCHPNRPTLTAIQKAGFRFLDQSCDEPAGMPRLFRPVCSGTAVAAGNSPGGAAGHFKAAVP